MSKPLTTRQRSVYEFIESYILQKGYGPTVREIAEAVHLSIPSTVHVHLKTLEEKGYIVRDPRNLAQSPYQANMNKKKRLAQQDLATPCHYPLLGMLPLENRFLPSIMSKQPCSFPPRS